MGLPLKHWTGHCVEWLNNRKIEKHISVSIRCFTNYRSWLRLAFTVMCIIFVHSYAHAHTHTHPPTHTHTHTHTHTNMQICPMAIWKSRLYSFVVAGPRINEITQIFLLPAAISTTTAQVVLRACTGNQATDTHAYTYTQAHTQILPVMGLTQL